MEEFDIMKEVWNEGHQTTPILKSVQESAKFRKMKSVNLVAKIVYKTKIEWLLTWVLLLVGGTIGVINNYWIVVSFFILPFIPYFIDYLRRLKKLNSFDAMNTLEYLKNVDSYISKSYQQQLKFILFIQLPYSLIFGFSIGVYLGVKEEGKDWAKIIDQPILVMGVIIFSLISLSLCYFLMKKNLSNFLNYWIDKFYGKELNGIKQMIKDLEGE